MPTPTADPAPVAAALVPSPVAEPAAAPAPTPTPTPTPEPSATPAEPVAPATPAPTPAAEPAAAPTDNSQVLADTVAAVGGTPSGAAPEGTPKTSVHTKVIEPINDISVAPPDLNALLAQEESKTVAGPAAVVNDVADPAAPGPIPTPTPGA